ncbi:MAG: hypothetical protein Q4A79_00945 [Candidatus Saccharibacteria bacterium]|nr:hypothetical protein [Candidatus Saccharibacteria bacterium]
MVINKVLRSTSALGSLAFLIVLCGMVSPFDSVSASSTVDFQVNVHEVLSVSVTTSNSVVSGDINQFLRNKVSLNVQSNNGNGFRASMTTSTESTALANTSDPTSSIPTLSQNSTRGNFPANSWGYSLSNYPDGTIGDNDEGSDNSIYKPLVPAGTTPITLLSSSSVSSGSQNIYFGAKADTSVDAGTYTNVVIISVVSGEITEDNPAVPDAPATSSDTATNNPSYNSTYDRTVHTASSSDNASDTQTIVTEVSSGDTRTSYAAPQGVVNSESGTNQTSVAAGLAAASAVMGTAGVGLFVAGKKSKSED